MHKLLAHTIKPQPHTSAAAQDNGAAPSLTIYNQNFFVARDHLTLDLKPGTNQHRLRRSHCPSRTRFRHPPRSHRTPAPDLEQSYRADPSRRKCCFRFTRAKRLIFQVQRGDKFETFPRQDHSHGYASGVTYINGYPQGVAAQPIVQVNGVLQFGLPGQPLFPALSDDSILKPTLTWQLATTQAGRSEAEISYVSAA